MAACWAVAANLVVTVDDQIRETSEYVSNHL